MCQEIKPPVKKLILHAGDFYFDRAGTHMHALLGSCISITLWHPTLKIGGMCHFALPRPDNLQSKGLNARYAEDSMILFERAAIKAGTRLSEYQGKIFGGGMINHEKTDSPLEDIQRLPIGSKNSTTAYRLLAEAGVDIKVAHVGEYGYRQIIFDLNTGDVWVKFTPVSQLHQDTRSLHGKV